ncbi:MAG: GAF domain-containing SpoIIE family protein phosphatase [Candidatus Eisenbacteria bacterium]
MLGRSKDSKDQVAGLAEENVRLKRALEELAILNDLARDIAGTLDRERVINSIVRRSLQVVEAEQGVVTLVEKKTVDEDDLMKTLVRTNLTTSTAGTAYHFDRSLLGWMQIHKKPLLTNGPREDDRFRGVKWEESIRNLLSVPLMVKSELTGVLSVYNKKGEGGFTADDQRILAIIAGQSAQVVESARLYEEEKALSRVREELRFASDIQQGLLPKAAPTVERYDIAGKTIPAQDVGGDYFDFIAVRDGRLAFCLGDVTGKGLPAAMLMSNLQATIRGQTLADCTPCECMSRSNELLYRSTDPVKFATLFYGVLCREKDEVCYCSAGHDRPYLLSEGKDPVRLEPGGMMLGAMEGVPYEHDCLFFAPGDTLVVYSDGITEAMAAGGGELGEEFGEERLEPLLRENFGKSSAEIVDAVVKAVRAHTAGRAQSDDMTLVVVRRTD